MTRFAIKSSGHPQGSLGIVRTFHSCPSWFWEYPSHQGVVRFGLNVELRLSMPLHSHHNNGWEDIDVIIPGYGKWQPYVFNCPLLVWSNWLVYDIDISTKPWQIAKKTYCKTTSWYTSNSYWDIGWLQHYDILTLRLQKLSSSTVLRMQRVSKFDGTIPWLHSRIMESLLKNCTYQ